MTDNIRPEHYRTGKSDLYEAWYQTYPFEQYRAIMQAIAERYMRRDKNDRVEDLGKAIYTLERLKEKEIEHAGGSDTKEVYIEKTNLLKRFREDGYKYLARDHDGDLCVYARRPFKVREWTYGGEISEYVEFGEYFPEVKWSDEEPTKIADLLETYENGGENGK